MEVNSVRLLNKIDFHKFQNDKKFNPDKIIFYSNKSQEKFCDLYISDFNSHDCKYTTLKRSDLVSFLKDKIQDLIDNQKLDTSNKINIEILKKLNIVSKKYNKMKILASGEITKKIDLNAHFVSKKAEEKLKKVGGSVDLIK